MVREHRSQETRLEDGDARSQSEPPAAFHLVADLARGVRVDEIDGSRQPVGAGLRQVHGAGIDEAAADRTGRRERLVVPPALLDAAADADGRIEDCVRPPRQDRSIGGEVEGRRLVGRARRLVAVRMHDRRAGSEARQCVVRDLAGQPRHPGVALARGHAVQRHLEQDGRCSRHGSMVAACVATGPYTQRSGARYTPPCPQPQWLTHVAPDSSMTTSLAWESRNPTWPARLKWNGSSLSRTRVPR